MEDSAIEEKYPMAVREICNGQKGGKGVKSD
jgi:hypothetical protein